MALRIENRSSSWIAGDWKSGTVKRGAPRSMPTTFNPVRASSSAISEPVRPTPMVTTSTCLKRFAMMIIGLGLGQSGGNSGIHDHVSMDILSEAGRRSIDRDAMLIDQFIVGGIGARKADHAPRHHVAIASVDRVAEEALQSALPKMLEENIGRHAAEILLAGFKASEVGVLL